MIKAFIDASTKGNPGPSGGGIVLLTSQEQKQYHFPLPTLTNHQAEFEVFLHLLDMLMENNQNEKTIMVYSDSKVLVSTVDKNYTRNLDFKDYLSTIQRKLPHFPLLILQWIPEKQNKGADNLARQGLQKALKLQNR